MIGGIYFAGAPFAGVLRSAGAAAAALAGSASLTFSTAGALDNPPQYLAASVAIVWTTDGAMDSPPAYLAADATIRFTTAGTMDRPPAIDTGIGIVIDGVPVTARVRIEGVTIRDILNDAPNTASFTIEGAAPAVGQKVRITTGDVLLFTGAVQTIDQAYELLPKHLAWDLSAIDDTADANARRPFGSFADISATTIAQQITTTFAPGFSTAGIAPGLPPVTIVFDGADLFITCLTRLATAIGGYCKIFDQTVYLFTDDLDEPPNPIDDDHPFLDSPPISVTTDSSQLRTRVYGKGYGETVPADIAAGETLIPIQDGVMFPPTGGTAIAGLTSGGAQSETIAFTGVVLESGGTLVGPGAAPPNAPIVATVAGAGVESGLHDYAYLFVTAAGRSATSPVARVTMGVLAPPATAPSANVQAGAGPNDGAHQFALSFVTATGETPPGATVLATTTSTPIPPPGTCPATQYPGQLNGHNTWAIGATVYLTWAWEGSDGGVTTPGANSVPFVATEAILTGGTPTGQARFAQCLMPAQPAGVTSARVYFNVNGAWAGYTRITFWSAYAYIGAISGTGAPPGVNTASIPVRTVVLSGLPTHALATGRKVWGTAAGGSQLKLIASINTSDPSYTVTTADAALGANAPTGNTATGLNRATVTWPNSGSTSVTNIELYRSTAGSTALKLLYTVGSNTAGTITDSTPDASLGAAAPTGDTSGLTQPSGQVNPGATIVPVASAAPFRPTGGWASMGSGGQTVRYTGVSGNTLTGIPPSGAGAVTTAVTYGSQAIPAPMLVGVTGLTKPMLQGSAVHIWIQRDDLLAQAEHAARTGGDGIVEFLIVDTRRGVPSLTARCDADLAMFSRPIVTVTYATRDMKTKSGKPIVIDLPSQQLAATLTIQDVTITKFDIVPGLAPVFTVRASSVRFSLEDTLRRLIAGGQTEVNA